MSQRARISRKWYQLFLGGTIGLLVLAGFLPSESGESDSAQTAHFSAAASLKEVLEDITEQFHLDYPQIEITLDFGSSGAIRQKVTAGAPIDGVFLASEQEIAFLIDAGSVEAAQPILTNQLVAIQPIKAEASVDNLIDQLREAAVIAIGEGQSVPAGSYALEVIDHLGLIDELEGKLVQAADVRQVLSYVALGNADLGFVYATDAALSQKVRVTAQIDPIYHDRILYTSALVTDSPHQETAAIFQQYLRSEKAKRVYHNYHFGCVAEQESEEIQ